MNHPKVQMLIDLGTNKLKQALGKAKSMVDGGTAAMKEKLASLELPALKTDKFKAGLGRARDFINDTFKRPIDAPEINPTPLRSSLGGIKSMVVGALGLAAIGAGIGTAITAGLQGDAQKVSFETLGGDLKGGKLYSDLTKFAQESIFGNELYQNAQTMLAFGVSVDTVMPKLKMLGDISMGNKERLGSLNLAYSQIVSTGRLMGQDLLQLVNAGFNPLQIISEKTGLSMATLKKKMEDGQISANLVTKAFESATSEGGRFYKMTERIAATPFGQWEAMKGQLQGIALEFGTSLLPAISQLLTVGAPLLMEFGNLLMALSPVFNAVISAASPLLGILSQLISFITEHKEGVGNLIVVLGGGYLAFKTITTGIMLFKGAMAAWTIIAQLGAVATGQLTMAQWLLNAAITANPIGLVIAAIAGLIAGMVYAYKHFKEFRAGVDACWEGIKQFGNVLYELTIGHIVRLMSGLTGLGKALYSLFTGDFKKAAEEGKNALLNLSGANTLSAAYDQGKQIGTAISKGYNDSIQKTIDVGLGKTIGVKKNISTMDVINGHMEKLKGIQAAKNLNPDKVDATGKGKEDWSFTDGKNGTKGSNSSDRITGSSQHEKNITIRFDSYIKGDVISQNQQISSMSSDQLDKWLREHFTRLLHSVDAAY